MLKSRDKEYYYMIKKDDLSYSMIKYSYWGIFTIIRPPTHDELVAYEINMRKVTNTVTGETCYLLPFSYSFSAPMAGFHFYTIEELKIELADAKYEHNQEDI